jgi:hypothetical protein
LDLAPRKRAIARPPWEAYAIHAALRYTCLRDCSRHDSSSLKPRWSAVGGVRQGLTAPRVDGKRCTTPGATNIGLAPKLHAVPEIQTHGSHRGLLQSKAGRFCSCLRSPSASSDHLSLRASVRLLSLSINRSLSALDEPVILSEPPHWHHLSLASTEKNPFLDLISGKAD